MTDWLGSDLTPADFDAALAPASIRRALDAGQDALFTTGTPTRAPKPPAGPPRVPGEVALFGDDFPCCAEVIGAHPMSAYEGALTDRLARGESVPEHPGACTRPGCGHGRIWHSHANRAHPCERCDCGRYAGQDKTGDTTP